MNGVERGKNEILGDHRHARKRRAASLLGAEAAGNITARGEESGAAGDMRIAAAAKGGHTAVSHTIVPPTEVGPEVYHG